MRKIVSLGLALLLIALGLGSAVQAAPTALAAGDIAIVGFNFDDGDQFAFVLLRAVEAIKSAGYTNLIERDLGQTAYSYVFEGQAGYLDHALATGSLASQVVAATEWHINADEPIVLDYNTEFKTSGQISSLYSADPYRSSDHDPVVVGLTLNP